MGIAEKTTAKQIIWTEGRIFEAKFKFKASNKSPLKWFWQT